MKKSLLQIINEEIQDFYSDWQQEDEPSLADKYYEKRGITMPQEAPPEQQINAELIGYVGKDWLGKLGAPVPVYKNPKTLEGFVDSTRGILMNNGDFYVAQSYKAFHDGILELLAEKGIIPLASTLRYDRDFPEEFVAVQRAGSQNSFGQSSIYDEFPLHYQEIFEIGNRRQPFTFKAFDIIH